MAREHGGVRGDQFSRGGHGATPWHRTPSALRSGKKLRHKSTNTNLDKISNLPDSLLIEILSLLPPSDVKQTRLVSKRWKNLFAFLPNLYFHLGYPSQFENFHVFVDQTLAIRGDMPIEKLLLKTEVYNVGYDCEYDLLRTFARFKVPQELELRSPTIVYTKFYWDLLKTWDNLVGLTLDGKILSNLPNDKLILPCLKKLSLLSVNFKRCELLVNLLNGCPALEEVFVEGRGLYDRDVAVFKVSLLSLKRLRISFSRFFTNCFIKVLIDAPKLEYIYINDNATTIDYCLTNPSSLVEADICHRSESFCELIPFLISAKILRLNVHSTSVSYGAHVLNMPVFPNLVRLVIGAGLDFLPFWLNSMPNLEHITLSYSSDRFFIAEQDLPEEPPVCLRFKLKEIEVHKDSHLTQEEFTFMRYLLEHSTILEKLRFSGRSTDPKRRKQLLNFHRGSERCQIEFV